MQEIVFTSNVCLVVKERKRPTEWLPWLVHVAMQSFVPIIPFPQDGGNRLIDTNDGYQLWTIDQTTVSAGLTNARDLFHTSVAPVWDLGP